MVIQRICWYDEHKKELQGNKLAKVRAFNRLGLIKPLINDVVFEVLPLPKNKQVHRVFFDGLNNSCSCQAFQIKGEFCSHLYAVSLFLENKKGVIQ